MNTAASENGSQQHIQHPGHPVQAGMPHHHMMPPHMMPQQDPFLVLEQRVKELEEEREESVQFSTGEVALLTIGAVGAGALGGFLLSRMWPGEPKKLLK